MRGKVAKMLRKEATVDAFESGQLESTTYVYKKTATKNSRQIIMSRGLRLVIKRHKREYKLRGAS